MQLRYNFCFPAAATATAAAAAAAAAADYLAAGSEVLYLEIILDAVESFCCSEDVLLLLVLLLLLLLLLPCLLRVNMLQQPEAVLCSYLDS